MAKDSKRILDQTIGAFKELKEQVKAYKDELASLEVGSEQWTQTAQKLANAQKQVDAINKAAKGTLVSYDKEQANSINQLKELIKLKNQERNAMDMNSKEYKAATDELKVLNDKLREAGTSAGDWKANVGNYANSIKDAFGELGGAATGLSGNMLGLNASMLKLAANPVGAVILAITTAIAGLARGIKTSEENTNRWLQVMAPIKALFVELDRWLQSAADKFLTFAENMEKSEKTTKIWEGVLQAVIYVFNDVKTRIEAVGNIATDITDKVKGLWEKFKEWGDGLKNTFEPVVDFVNNITNAIKDKLEPVVDWIVKQYNRLASTNIGKAFGLKTIEEVKKSWNDAGKKSEEFAEQHKKTTEEVRKANKAQMAMTATMRNGLVAAANLRNEIAELDAELSEARADEDFDRAIDLAIQKQQKSIELAKVEASMAQAEYEAIRKRNSLTQSTAAEKDAEAQALARATEAQGAYNNAVAAGNREIERLKKQKSAKEKAEEAKALAEAIKVLNAELKNLDTDYANTLATLKEPLKPEGAEIDKDSLNAYYDAIKANNDAEYQAYVELTEAKIAELEKFIEIQKAAGRDVQTQELQLAALRKEQSEGYIKQYQKMNDANTESDKERAKSLKLLQRSEIQGYANLFDSVSGMFEQNTIAYKATATAKALINTYLAATGAFADAPGGPIARGIAMAATLAAGIAEVMQIWKTDVKNPSISAGSSAPTVAEPAVIESQPFTYSRSVQTTDEEDRLNQPIYVTVTDIEDGLNKAKVTDRESKF